MTRFRAEVPSPQANNLSGPTTSPDFYVHVDSEVSWDLTDIDVAEELVECTVLKTKRTEVEEACRSFDFSVSSSMTEVADFPLRRVFPPVADNSSYNDALYRTPKLSRLQIKYNRLAAQKSSVT